MTLHKRLKLALLVLLGVAGLALVVHNQLQAGKTASVSEKTVLFGSVDLADDDDEDDTDLATDEDDIEEDDEDANWLENFVKSHKTPWSKEVLKED